MPKRNRDSSSLPVSGAIDIRPDPLKKVPPQFAATVAAGGFTVCDFVIVLAEMARLFKLAIRLTGPAEGSIEFSDCPSSLWISEHTRKKHQYAGQCTELRFSLQEMSNDDKRLRFVSDLLAWPQVHCGDSNEAAADAIVKQRLLRSNHYTEEEKRQLLKQPMPLCLREGYPYYSWPRWMFGAFEGFVMQRIDMKRGAAR